MPSGFRLRTHFEPKGDQPVAIEQLLRGLAANERHQVLLGVTGSGKTFTIANVIQQSQQAHAHPGAQQDAGRPALRRDARALPRERGRVLRQLLRLLPARGVRPVDRHVHREGLDHQRRDRPDAPLGHGRAAVAARRHHRRQRLVHLRHRQRRELLGSASSSSPWARSCAATCCCGSSSTSSTSATTSTSTAARSACAATWSRSSPPTSTRRAIRIEFFGDEVESIKEVDPLRGRVKSTLAELRHLPGLALRDAAGADAQRHREHPRGAARAARSASTGQGRFSRSSGSSSARSTTSR